MKQLLYNGKDPEEKKKSISALLLHVYESGHFDRSILIFLIYEVETLIYFPNISMSVMYKIMCVKEVHIVQTIIQILKIIVINYLSKKLKDNLEILV